MYVSVYVFVYESIRSNFGSRSWLKRKHTLWAIRDHVDSSRAEEEQEELFELAEFQELQTQSQILKSDVLRVLFPSAHCAMWCSA